MIVASNPFSRSGLHQTLSQQDRLEILEVAACDPGEDGQEAMTRIAGNSPDVVLLDIDYPSLSGLELGRKIVRHFPGIKVVMLSDNPYGNKEELVEVIKTGAAAYLKSRHCSATELIETIRRVSNEDRSLGDTASSRPKIALRALSRFHSASSTGSHMQEIAAALTRKEVQVLTLIAGGSSNKQIAIVLGTSHQTTKNHVSAILRKISANHRAHAVSIGLRDGLISIDSGQATGHQDSGSTETRLV